MNIIPAIDIRNGRCVRLYQGKYDKEIVYDEDPVNVALRWKKFGAQMLHVVDLDGALSGKVENMEIVKKIINETGIPVQFGGGIRNYDSVEKLFEIGVSKIIVSTISLENEALFKKIINKINGMLIVSLDIKNNILMKNGWMEKSNRSVNDAIKTIEKIGVQTIIYTDTVRDGTLTEPNYKVIKEIREITKMKIIVAGGISSLDQIKKLKKLSLDGVILGKALYEGKIDLREAIYAG